MKHVFNGNRTPKMSGECINTYCGNQIPEEYRVSHSDAKKLVANNDTDDLCYVCLSRLGMLP